MCDKTGMLCKGMEGLNWMQEKMVEVTNLEHKTGTHDTGNVRADCLTAGFSRKNFHSNFASIILAANTGIAKHKVTVVKP